MGGPIIVGFEESDAGREAIALAVHLARAVDAPLTVLHAYPLALDSPDYDAMAAEDAERRLRVAADLVPAGIAVTYAAQRAGSPAAALHDAARGSDARMVVIGSARQGAPGRVTPGSVAERLLHGAPCSVVLTPRGWSAPTRHGRGEIGVAFDGSSESRHALAAAERLAVGLGQSLRIIQVVEPLHYRPARYPVAGLDQLEAERRQRAQHEVDDAVAVTATNAHPSGRVLYGSPDAELAAQSGELELLVCGSRGYGPIRQVLLGGLSRRLTHLVTCALVVVPRGADPE